MRFVVVKLRTILAVVLAVVIIVGTTVAIYFGKDSIDVFMLAPKKLPIYCVEREDKAVALTFDASWGADKTEDILALLREYEQGATYFVVAFWAEKYADKLNKLKDNGIEIGTHSNVHGHMGKMSESQVELDLTTSIDTIKRVTGLSEINLFRCPFGEYSDTLLTVTDRLNLKTIQWDVDSLDWKDLSARQIAERVLNRVRNGSIILMHNDAKNIVEGLRLILEGLKVKGYKSLTVSELIYSEDYTIDNTGRQIKNQNQNKIS